MQQRPMNLFNKMALFFAKLGGVGMSPAEVAERRIERQKKRAFKRQFKHAGYVSNGRRQKERYARNRMDEQQRNSHKPGTVQPFHIFGNTSDAR